jgi:hypothetical protein
LARAAAAAAAALLTADRTGIMTELRTEIDIDAPAEVVWRILTDFPAYEQWNPFIREVVGVPAAGERLTIRLDSGSREMTFRPRILEADPPRALRWIGRLGARGVFDGEHIFEITAQPDGGVRFVQRENFSGLLTPVLLGMMLNSTRHGFEAMNEALKARAESRGG